MLWLSFCDPNLPKGKQLIGVVITDDFLAATTPTALGGLNPGGEMAMLDIGDAPIPEEWRNRMLSRAEVEELNRWMASA